MSPFAFHPEALEDLSELQNYIAEDSPDAADGVSTEIRDAILALVRFPHQGVKRPDLTSRPLRFKRVRNYLIAYAPKEVPLWVVAVIHGSRSPRVMAAILRDREQMPPAAN
jgi:plasmid stabilization system protein ParE